METVDTLPALQDKLLKCREHGARVFGIDGVEGSGKSTTANELHSAVGWSVLHVDDFLNRDRGSYLPHLRTLSLANCVRESRSPILVEGVCLLAVAAAAAFKLDVHIYIKRFSEYGYWLDEADCAFQGSAELRIAQLEVECAPLVRLLAEPGAAEQQDQDTIPELNKEIIRYHGQYQPASSANIIYRRAEPAA